jgi:hypothetical protein
MEEPHFNSLPYYLQNSARNEGLHHVKCDACHIYSPFGQPACVLGTVQTQENTPTKSFHIFDICVTVHH